MPFKDTYSQGQLQTSQTIQPSYEQATEAIQPNLVKLQAIEINTI